LEIKGLNKDSEKQTEAKGASINFSWAWF